MSKYEDYCIEDFVLDADFQNWVRYKTPVESAFWSKYIEQQPDKSSDVRAARVLLEGIYSRFGAELSEEEIESEISGLLSRIRNDQHSQPLSTRGVGVWSKPLFRWLAAATIVLIGGMAGFLAFYSGFQFSDPLAERGSTFLKKENNTNEPQTIFLSDESTVILEPNSTLSIPAQFSAEKREVYLSGAAYFKVSKDIRRPFLVYTNKLVTRVLGTSFIIKAFKDAKVTSVEVKEGKVSVFRNEDFERTGEGQKNESKGVVLNPNQKIVYETTEASLTKTLSEIPEIVPSSRKKTSFEYTNTPIREVLKDLKNAYQVDIIYDADLLSDCPITASLSTRPLLEKISIICEVIEAKYEVLDGQIIIYGKSCLE